MARITSPLPEHLEVPTRSTHFVAHGSLLVDRSIDREFRAAEAYLRADTVMAQTFDDLERAPEATYVLGNRRSDDHFDFAARAVTWDPHSALRTTEGGRQSPALGLGHELVHADEDAIVRERLASKYDPAYDNREERRVIRGAEAHAARTLGEGTRHDHSGTLAHVDSPTALA
ncbi:MAG: hypothetical protein NVS2B8_17250 [Vulcanimicrobiaceae bacterium]